VLADRPGVKSVDPMLAVTTDIDTASGALVHVNVIGSDSPVALLDGRWPHASGELVANVELDVRLGATVSVHGEHMKVVGRTSGLRYFVGMNAVFLSLADAQRLFVFGQPVVSGFAVHGALPPGSIDDLKMMTNAQVVSSLRRPVKPAASTIAFLDALLWVVAGGIIGTILYMTAIERLRDFAVLKAMGARGRQLIVAIAAQALVLSLASVIVAAIVSVSLAPVFPVVVEIPATSYLLTVGVAVAVGLLGSAAGVRRALAIDPALAFGG
jgi:putative ABC transport system permease protein